MAGSYNAGIVTAYGAAVRGGYTGTYEQFCAQQANYAQTAAAVEQAKTDAQAAAQRAQDVADSIPEDYTELTEEVGDLKEDLSAVSETLNGETNTFSNVSEYTSFPYTFVAGTTYVVTVVTGAARMQTRETADGSRVEWIAEVAVSSGTIINFTPSQNAAYIRILPNSETTVSIETQGIEEKVEVLSEKVTSDEQRIESLEEAKVNINGTEYTISEFTENTVYLLGAIGSNISLTPSYSSYNSTLCVPIKAGQVITLNARTADQTNCLGIVDTNLILTQKYEIGQIMDIASGLMYPVSVTAKNDGYALISTYPATFSKLSISNEVKAAANNGVNLSVWSPYPQLPADGSENADFDSENMTVQDVYNYLDALADKYPYCISAENLGNDATNTLPVKRYILGKRNRIAWLSTTTPLRYKWTNESTSYYTDHYSPRIGDATYSSASATTYTYTVSAVDNANHSVTINGNAYTRDGDTRKSMSFAYSMKAASGAALRSKITTIGTISSISGDNMTDSSGGTWVRYPLGDFSFQPNIATIYIGANEHGPVSDPRECAIVVSRLAKDICEAHAKDNKFLNYIRDHFRIVLIPVANPYGFDNSTRNNGNNVNLNRNYDTQGWSAQSDSDKGAYGGSEIETQYQIDSIMDSGALIALDLHCLGNNNSANDGKCHYGGTIRDYSMLNNIYDNMLSAYNLVCSAYGEGDYTTAANGQAFFNQLNMFGLLLEFQSREGETGSGTLHTSRIMEANYTFMLQILVMLISNFGEVLGMNYLT